MSTHAVIRSQFHASLAMLEEVIRRCPEELWTRTGPTAPFWHVAYHTLFYVHLYLQPTEADFTPWANHQDQANRLDPQENPPIPYTQAQLLDYLILCRQEVDRQLPTLNRDAASGFHWLPFTKLELRIYSIRHIMMHTGELAEQLGQMGIQVDWVGRA